MNAWAGVTRNIRTQAMGRRFFLLWIGGSAKEEEQPKPRSAIMVLRCRLDVIGMMYVNSKLGLRVSMRRVYKRIREAEMKEVAERVHMICKRAKWGKGLAVGVHNERRHT